jgi:hypothetical protein
MNSNRSLIAFCLVLICSPALVFCREQFVSLIPNGANVGGGAVRAAGHNSPNGGSRNAFGSDFAANQLTWTTQLCQRDSDGDGLSNGFELGDNCCEWSQGQSPAFGVDISNPGSSSGAYARPTTRKCTDYNCSNGIDPCAAASSATSIFRFFSRTLETSMMMMVLVGVAAILVAAE